MVPCDTAKWVSGGRAAVRSAAGPRECVVHSAVLRTDLEVTVANERDDKVDRRLADRPAEHSECDGSGACPGTQTLSACGNGHSSRAKEATGRGVCRSGGGGGGSRLDSPIKSSAEGQS